MTVSLKDWRNRVGMTQLELAAALGITERQLRRLENGESRSTRMLQLALEALDAEHNRKAALRRAARAG